MKEQCTSCSHINVCKIRSYIWDFIAKHSPNFRDVRKNDNEVIGIDLLNTASMACIRHEQKK